MRVRPAIGVANIGLRSYLSLNINDPGRQSFMHYPAVFTERLPPMISSTSAKSPSATVKPTVFADEKLPNGTRLVVVDVPGAKKVDFRVASLAGFGQEPQGKGGIAHLTEHLMFAGTGKRSEKEIDRQIKSWGGTVNAYTQPNELVVFGEMPNEKAKEGTAMLLDMYAHPSTDARVVERERRITEQEMRMKVGDGGVAFEVWREMVLGKNPVSDLPVTTADGWAAKSATPNDVREWRDRYLNGSNTVVFVAGDAKKMPLASIRKDAAKLEEGWQNDQRDSGMPKAAPSGRHLTMLKDSENVNVELEMAFPMHPFLGMVTNPMALNVASEILSNQLVDRIRVKKALAYAPYVRSGIDDSVLGVSASVEVHPRDVKQAVEIAARAVRRLPDSLSAELVEQTKASLMERYKGRLGSNERFVESAFDQAISGSEKISLMTERQLLNRLKKVTLAEVSMAAEILGDFNNMKMLAVGAVGEKVSADIKSGLDAAKVPSDLKVTNFNMREWLNTVQPTWAHSEENHDH